MSDAPATPAQSLTDDTRSRVQPIRRKTPGIGVALAWGLNLGALVALTAWLVFDSRVAHAMDMARWLLLQEDGLPSRSMEAQLRSLHFVGVDLIASVAAITTFYLVIGLFLGTLKSRGLRSWLAFTGMVAAWLALVGSRHDLSWFGQRWRLERQIDEFESVAGELRENWPKHDGAIDPVGPFIAYPAGRPRVLMPLTTPQSRPGVAAFSLVERSDAGGLRFELVARDAESWLEWHPDGASPASFIGGLETSYDLQRSSPLGNGWFLAQYRSDLAPRSGSVR